MGFIKRTHFSQVDIGESDALNEASDEEERGERAVKIEWRYADTVAILMAVLVISLQLKT